jgi:hypothetical protein
MVVMPAKGPISRNLITGIAGGGDASCDVFAAPVFA